MGSKKFCCGGWDRTTDLQVMSLTSYHCSTPRYTIQPNWIAKVLLFSDIRKFFCIFFTILGVFFAFSCVIDKKIVPLHPILAKEQLWALSRKHL